MRSIVLRALIIFLLSAQCALAQNVLFPANPGDMIVKGTVGAWAPVPGGTAGCVLTSQGPTAAPTWQCALALNFQLPPTATNTVWGNVSGTQQPASQINISQFLNTIDYDIQRPPLPGAIPYKGTDNLWHTAPPAQVGWVWTSQGAGVIPQWVPPGGYVPPGAAGTCLVSNGLLVAPSFQMCPAAASFVSSFNSRTGAVTPQSGDYSVGQVMGALSASDATATYAPLASPTFTGDPKAPTPATGDNDTSVATTAFVKAQSYLTTALAATTYLAKPGYTNSTTYAADYQCLPTNLAATNNTNCQTAITACSTFPTDGTKGCILQFPCGIISVSTGFTATWGMVVQGCGAGYVQQGGSVSPDNGGTTIKQACTACNTLFFQTADAITIRDIGFEGPSTGTGPFVNTATAGAFIFVQPEASVTSLPARALTITNVTTKGGFNAIYCWLCGNFSIFNNRIYASKNNGIELTNAALSDSGDDSIFANTIGGFPGWPDPVGDAIYLHTHGGIRIVTNKLINYVNLIHVTATQVGAAGARTGTLIIDANSLEEAQVSHIRFDQGVDTTASYGNIIITSNEFSNGFYPSFQSSIALVAGAAKYIDFVKVANNIMINSTAFVGALCMFIADGSFVTLTNNFCDMQGSSGAIGIGVVSNAINVAVLDNQITATPGGRYIFSVAAVLRDTINALALGEIPPNASNGTQVFTTDAAPGSSPCVGGSTGSMVFKQNGALKCF